MLLTYSQVPPYTGKNREGKARDGKTGKQQRYE